MGMFFLLLLPTLSSAAVQQTQGVEKDTINATASVSSSESKKNDKKSLANEPEPLGKLLYENHCLSCHESMVHIRGAHKAKTFTDVQYWVGRWAQELDIKWSADEIDAVVQHLNDTFYHY
ncbi:hypothetical protein [Kaarinaea lacus]